MALMEQRVEGAWVAKQTAKGTTVATAIKRLRKAGGGMGVTRDDGQEVYSDGQRFGDRVDFVNTLVGEGNPVAMAQTGVLGYLVYLMMGAETVTGAAAPFTHTVTPAGTGFWFGAWKRVGETVIQRQRFNDCRMRSLRIEGSSANKVVKATPDFVSLDPGEIVATDPAKADDATVPWKHTEGEGRYLVRDARPHERGELDLVQRQGAGQRDGFTAEGRDEGGAEATARSVAGHRRAHRFAVGEAHCRQIIQMDIRSCRVGRDHVVWDHF